MGEQPYSLCVDCLNKQPTKNTNKHKHKHKQTQTHTQTKQVCLFALVVIMGCFDSCLFGCLLVCLLGCSLACLPVLPAGEFGWLVGRMLSYVCVCLLVGRLLSCVFVCLFVCLLFVCCFY